MKNFQYLKQFRNNERFYKKSSFKRKLIILNILYKKRNWFNQDDYADY